MKIVVPLDLSMVASQAIEPATDIAQGLGDEILLVTVNGLKLRGSLRDMAESEGVPIPEMIEAYLKSAADAINRAPADYSVLAGDHADETLVGFAKPGEVRMIVMATHGRSGLDKWRMGSVAERVVRHSTVPVLVIPTRKSAWAT